MSRSKHKWKPASWINNLIMKRCLCAFLARDRVLLICFRFFFFFLKKVHLLSCPQFFISFIFIIAVLLLIKYALSKHFRNKNQGFVNYRDHDSISAVCVCYTNRKDTQKSVNGDCLWEAELVIHRKCPKGFSFGAFLMTQW